MQSLRLLGIGFVLLALCACTDGGNENDSNEPLRSFISSFEQIDDFAGFYLTEQGHLGTTRHELSSTQVHSGTFAHRGWIDGANDEIPSTNTNHRGYPTVQLHKTTGGSFRGPILVTLWVWLDMPLNPAADGGVDDWFSFATFTSDESDNWSRTVLVNLGVDGFVHLMHVPNQGEQTHIFQTDSVAFPQRQWVELTIYLDFSAAGYAKVWQDGILVSHASVQGMDNRLAQAHFGMYCPPQMSSGEVFNDDLRIEMVTGEPEMATVADPAPAMPLSLLISN